MSCNVLDMLFQYAVLLAQCLFLQGRPYRHGIPCRFDIAQAKFGHFCSMSLSLASTSLRSCLFAVQVSS